MKSDTILTLGALGLGGYLIYKSNIAQGIGDAASGIGGGIGEAFQGTGGAISTAAQGLGQGISDVSGDVAELTSFIGEFGNWTAQQFEELQKNSLRENQQSDYIDRQAFEQTKDPLTDIQAQTDIFLAQGGANRSLRFDEFKTNVQDNALDFVEGVSEIPKYNPLTALGNWIKNKVSITGNVVAQDTSSEKTSSLKSSSSSSTSSSSSSSSTSSSSSGSIKTSSLKPNKFLEAAGYQGTSTSSGITYSKPSTSFSSVVNSALRSSKTSTTTTKPTTPKPSVISRIGSFLRRRF